MCVATNVICKGGTKCGVSNHNIKWPIIKNKNYSQTGETITV